MFNTLISLLTIFVLAFSGSTASANPGVAEIEGDPGDGAVIRSRVHTGIKFAGIVEVIDPVTNTWTISGSTVVITPQTEIIGDIVVGSLVKVNAYTCTDGTLTARVIELVEAGTILNINGVVDTIGDAAWVIGGSQVYVTEKTVIRNEVSEGDWVIAKVMINELGTLTALVIHLPGYEYAPGNDDPGNGDNGNYGEVPGYNGDGNEGKGNDDNGNDDTGMNGNDDTGMNGGDDTSDNGNDDTGDNGNADTGNNGGGGSNGGGNSSGGGK